MLSRRVVRRPILEHLDQLATELGDVLDGASTHLSPVAEGARIPPASARVHQIVLDPERPGDAPAVHDARRDCDESAVTDDAERLARIVHVARESSYGFASAKLVRRPASGNDEP